MSKRIQGLGDYRLRQFSDAMLKPSFAYALPVSPACTAVAHTDHMLPCPESPQLVTSPEARYEAVVCSPKNDNQDHYPLASCVAYGK